MIYLIYIYPMRWEAQDDEYARRFAESYCMTPRYGQADHRLLVVCNGGPPDHEAGLIFKGAGCEFIECDDSGWDIGAYQAVSAKLNGETCTCVYLGGSTYFPRAGWLRRIAKTVKQHPGALFGASASFEKTSHLRSTAFWCRPQLLASYPSLCSSPGLRHEFEHGKESFTAWAMAETCGAVYLATWDRILELPEWRTPANGFRSGDQSDCIIWDRAMGQFEHASLAERKLLTAAADGHLMEVAKA